MKRISYLLNATLSAALASAAFADVPTSAVAQPTTQPVAPTLTPLPLSAQQIAQLRHFAQIPAPSANPATQAAMNAVLPASPTEATELRARTQALDKALAIPTIPQALLAKTVRQINTVKNTVPPLLHLVYGYDTSLTFVGENGKPWPIRGVKVGNEAVVTADQPTKGNVLNVTLHPQSPWNATNIKVFLADRVEPATLYLQTAGDFSQGLDASITLRLSGLPAGTQPLAMSQVGAVDDSLLNAVNLAPGQDWQIVTLDNANLPFEIRMWRSSHQEQTIVRVSAATLLSPEWQSQASNPDGTTTAYQFQGMPLTLLVNDNQGNSYKVSVKDLVSTMATHTVEPSTDTPAPLPPATT